MVLARAGAAVTLAVPATQTARSPRRGCHSTSVVDGVAGRLGRPGLVVRGTRIERVAPAAARCRRQDHIEGRGKVAMPGLIDAGVRLAASPRRRAGLLAAGVTTVATPAPTRPPRPLAPGSRQRPALRAEVAAGLRAAADRRPGGPPLAPRPTRSTPRGPGWSRPRAAPARPCARDPGARPALSRRPRRDRRWRAADLVYSPPTRSTTSRTRGRSTPWFSAARC